MTSRVMDADEFLRTVSESGRNDGPALLVAALTSGEIDRCVLPEVIGSVWAGAEFPERQLGTDLWLRLFETAGYTSDGTPADRPPGPLTLYRTASRRRRRGMAWTGRRETARWYRDRENLSGQARGYEASLWTCSTVPPGRLLARIGSVGGQGVGGLGEDEYVVDTRGLTITPDGAP